ncbi:MAG TPA: hypothetical protein PKY81_14015 [bacterium]|nr:hypothetical protein [bacterium]HPN32062.1 hypothetical protein [bacterium]
MNFELSGKDIICISSMDYEEHITAKQQVMKLLAKNNRVFFCQKETGVEHLIKHPQLYKKIFLRYAKPYYETDGMNIINLPLLLPGRYYSHLINSINQKIIANYLLKIFCKFNIINPVLWTFVPHSAPLFKILPSSLKIYHCAENYNIMTTGRKKIIMQEQENDLCKISDAVFCVTAGVHNKIKEIVPEKAFLTYNGVDADNYKKAAETLKEPDDLKNIPSPRLLHMGMINGKVDLDLAIFIANSMPNVSVIFIGDIFYSDINLQKFNQLKNLKNVYFLGMKKVESLPGFLANCTAGLILGKKNEWTKITKPLKSYEYLASGIPVSAIGFPELKSFEEYIYYAETYKEFINNLEAILSGKRKSSKENQIAFAQTHSWKNRVNEMKKIIFGLQEKN